MSKLLIEIFDVHKHYGTKNLFNINHLTVSSGDRIALIGANGSGKSTLLKILRGNLDPDKGHIDRLGSMAYLEQPQGDYEHVDYFETDPYFMGVLDVYNNEGYSGGERTKRALADVLSTNPEILLLDEPTTNMDMKSVENLERILESYQGAYIIVSHDIAFIDTVANKLWIIENNAIRVFEGTYALWEAQKKLEFQTEQDAYDAAVREKKRLEAEVRAIREQARKVIKKPKHMSSKEARLYQGTASIQQGHVQKRAKAMLSRKNHKPLPQRPLNLDPINIKLGAKEHIRAHNVISGENVRLTAGNSVLLEDAFFDVASNKKTVILGNNGCGKTTLIQAIISGHPDIKVNPQVRIGVFSQFHESLDTTMDVFNNVMSKTIESQGHVRTVLHNLRFTDDDIIKPISVLSGGERAKLVLAQLIVSDINMLILDEPTNHLDLDTQDAILGMLQLWTHTMLIVTHDRRVIEQLTDDVLMFESKHIVRIHKDDL